MSNISATFRKEDGVAFELQRDEETESGLRRYIDICTHQEERLKAAI